MNDYIVMSAKEIFDNFSKEEIKKMIFVESIKKDQLSKNFVQNAKNALRRKLMAEEIYKRHVKDVYGEYVELHFASKSDAYKMYLAETKKPHDMQDAEFMEKALSLHYKLSQSEANMYY